MQYIFRSEQYAECRSCYAVLKNILRRNISEKISQTLSQSIGQECTVLRSMSDRCYFIVLTFDVWTLRCTTYFGLRVRESYLMKKPLPALKSVSFNITSSDVQYSDRLSDAHVETLHLRSLVTIELLPLHMITNDELFAARAKRLLFQSET